jgi:hypothetical protein
VAPKPETVLALANRIVELKKHLSDEEAKWNAMFGSRDDDDDYELIPRVPIVRKKTTTREQSGTRRIVAAFEANPLIDFAPMNISAALHIPLGTTRTSLSKLVQKGLIEKRGPGLYGALNGKAKGAPM